MKKSMDKKAASSVAIIGGSDGPTSVFIVGKQNVKMTIGQRMQRILFQFRKKHIEKTIRANPHSVEQVIKYAKEKWGYSEIDSNDPEYKLEYKRIRTSFILQYKPQLLGDLANVPELKGHSKEEIELFLEQQDQRQKAAEEIPIEVFNIDLHILKKEDPSIFARIFLEGNYDYISNTVSGKKWNIKKYNKAYREIYKYYGVSQKDIDNKSKRYEELIRTLARR